MVNKDPKRFLDEGADFLATSLVQFSEVILPTVTAHRG
jgi:hypothetical protein